MAEELKARIDLAGVDEAVQKMNHEFHKIIVGQQKMIDFLIAALLADGHVLLEGVPGVAKTLAAKLLARTVSVDFSRIQFTPDLMPSDVIGTTVFNVKTSEFAFNQGPVFANLVLVDEINRAPAKTQAALFEVMEERQVTVDGVTHSMTPPFLVVATQNPIEQEGTYRLPEAQIDRFLFKIEVDYPSADEEATFLQSFGAGERPNDLTVVKPVFSAAQLLDYQQKVRAIVVEEDLIKYVVDIVQKTRNNAGLYLGGSPRASLALLAGAKAFAAMAGRDFVTPEDIHTVVKPALRHRVLLTPEREMEGVQPDEIISQIVAGLEVPR